MPSPKFSEIITNPYTGEEKEITASKEDVLQRRIYAQQDTWEQEQLALEGRQAANEATAQLRVAYGYLRSLSHIDLQPLTPSIYESALLSKVRQRKRYRPQLLDVEQELGVNKAKKLISHLSKSKKEELTALQRKAEILYNDRVEKYNEQIKKDYAEYQEKCAEETQKVNNLMRLLQNGSPTAAHVYYSYALNRDDFSVDNQTRFTPEFHSFKFRRRPLERGSKELVGKVSLSYRIPNKEEIPAVAEYVYNQKTNVVEEKEYDAKTAVSWRRRVAEAVLLRVVAMLFNSDPFDQIQEITITGYLRYYDAGYGQDRVKELEKRRTERMAKADAIGAFMFRLREMDQPLEHFDERLWLEVIDCVYVRQDGKLTFKFQNGREVRV